MQLGARANAEMKLAARRVDQNRIPIHASELPQVASSQENRVAAELPRMISADVAPAPFWGFDGWLDDLYNANGLFSEDVGVSHLPDR